MSKKTEQKYTYRELSAFCLQMSLLLKAAVPVDEGLRIMAEDGADEDEKKRLLFLADEINRTSSKTQSALLEVMEEGRVTVDGVTRELPKPFIVIATQNPVGSVGTQLLPESQMDRFMVRLSMGYPDISSEIEMLKGRDEGNPLAQVQQVITRRELVALQQEVERVFIHDAVYEYIAHLIQKTRENQMILLGVSPRGTIALSKMAKAVAYWKNRGYVIPDDVSSVFETVAAHRMVLSPKARVNRITIQELAAQVLSSVTAPRLVFRS